MRPSIKRMKKEQHQHVEHGLIDIILDFVLVTINIRSTQTCILRIHDYITDKLFREG